MARRARARRRRPHIGPVGSESQTYLGRQALDRLVGRRAVQSHSGDENRDARRSRLNAGPSAGGRA